MVDGNLTPGYQCVCVSKYSGSEIKPILYPLATGFAIMFDTLIVQGNTNGGKLLTQPTKNGIQRCNHNDICKISSDIYIYRQTQLHQWVNDHRSALENITSLTVDKR